MDRIPGFDLVHVLGIFAAVLLYGEQKFFAEYPFVENSYEFFGSPVEKTKGPKEDKGPFSTSLDYLCSFKDDYLPVQLGLNLLAFTFLQMGVSNVERTGFRDVLGSLTTSTLVVFVNVFSYWHLLNLICRLNKQQVERVSTKSKEDRDSFRSTDSFLWKVIMENWLTNSFLLFVLPELKRFLSNALFYCLGVTGLKVDYRRVALMNNISAGITVACYLASTGFLAKVMDILSDSNPKDEGFKKMDRAFDVVADGTFTKLLGFFLMDACPEMIDGSVLNLPYLNRAVLANLILLLLTMLFVQSKDLRISLVQKVCCLIAFPALFDEGFSFHSAVMLCAVLVVSSPGFLATYTANLVKAGFGLSFYVPILLGMVVMGLELFSLQPQGITPSMALGVLPVLFHLDQTGFVFDLIEDQLPDKEVAQQLDIVGNQLKSVFKFFALSFLNSDPAFELGVMVGTETDSMGVGSTGLMVGFTAYVFYGLVDELNRGEKVDPKGEFKLGPVIQATNRGIRKLFIGSAFLLGDLSLGLLQALVMSGAIADNQKKIVQAGTLGDVGPEVARQVVQADMFGDFTKDVLYPVLVSKALLAVITFNSRGLLEGLRNSLTALRFM